MSHGHCYLWTPALVWTQVVTNGLIAIAYFAIAAGLAVLVRRLEAMPFGKMYWAFSLFIFACGLTHVFDILVIWHPRYWLDAGMRMVTAVASVGTALLLIPFIPPAANLTEGSRAERKKEKKGERLESIFEDMESIQETRQLLQQELESGDEDITELATELSEKTSSIRRSASASATLPRPSSPPMLPPSISTD